MTTVQAGLTYYKQLNEQIRAAQDSEITVENVIGQRYIGCGSSGKTITAAAPPTARSPCTARQATVSASI